MDRRNFLGMALGSLIIGPPPVLAQRAPRMWRIGILSGGAGVTASSATGAADSRSAFLIRAFEEQGYVEGKNVVFVTRNAGGRIERLPELAAEVAGASVDVIVTTGSEATRAAKHATSTIPIVFLGPSYPVEEGLVASFQRPGGNITGITLAHSDVVSKLLQLLRDIAPKLADAAVAWDPNNPGNVFIVQDMERAAEPLHLQVKSVPIRSANEADAAIATIAQLRPGALIVMPSPVVFPLARRLGELAIKLRIPSISSAKPFLEQGILLSYGAESRDLDRRVTVFVDRILKGASPADLAVERPTKFELGVNMKTAKAIGLTIPQPLMMRADEVIQ